MVYRVSSSNPSWGRRRSGGRGLAVELGLKALESWMENAKDGEFIRNGSKGGWVVIVRCGTQILNNLSPFFACPQEWCR